MRKFLIQLTAFLFCIFTTMNAGDLTAYANSAQTHFFGVDSTGAIMTDDESPIIVENELLTFDIASLPSNYYSTAEDFATYDAKVTAQYTFYNPSEYTVTARLLFPFRTLPPYADGYYDEEYEFQPFDDTQKYNITIDGESVQKTVRHTLSFELFDLEQDLASLSDSFVKDDFYTPDLSVTKYVFRVQGVDTAAYKAANIAFDVAEGMGSYRILFPEHSGGHRQDDGAMRLSAWVEGSDDKFELYVFGTPLSEMPNWKFYRDGGVENGEEIKGSAVLESTESMTFLEFALSNRDADSPVSETDWYNALVEELKKSGHYGGDYPVVECPCYFNSFQHDLMRWYEYEITLAPEERIINTVTAPIYPDIDMGYSPSVFNYTYLLSPAKTWKSFGEIEIVVNTPYYVTDSSIDGVTKTENGYKMTLSGLPEDELLFTLSTSENPQKPIFGPNNAYLPEIIIGICVGAGVLLIGGGILALVLIRRRKRKHD